MSVLKPFRNKYPSSSSSSSWLTSFRTIRPSTLTTQSNCNCSHNNAYVYVSSNRHCEAFQRRNFSSNTQIRSRKVGGISFPSSSSTSSSVGRVFLTSGGLSFQNNNHIHNNTKQQQYRFSHYNATPAEGSDSATSRQPVTVLDIKKLHKNKVPISVSNLFLFFSKESRCWLKQKQYFKYQVYLIIYIFLYFRESVRRLMLKKKKK